ncbi:hypothetical protein DB347_02360 [Opitutaceae bacterium EW11]|nr:hypothetical protein DB347_02360 [Opitutaceae bacterium EW11]
MCTDFLARYILGGPSIAVRSYGTKCTLALLNISRDEAVRLFLKLLEGAEAVLATGEADSFLHHGVQTHYAQLRLLLLSMLKHPEKEAREAERVRTDACWFKGFKNLLNGATDQLVRVVIRLISQEDNRGT